MLLVLLVLLALQVLLVLLVLLELMELMELMARQVPLALLVLLEQMEPTERMVILFLMVQPLLLLLELVSTVISTLTLQPMFSMVLKPLEHGLPEFL